MSEQLGRAIGLIAGGGRFPFLLAEEARRSGRRVVAVGFKSNTDPALAEAVDSFAWLGLGQLGRLISFFKKEGVDRVAMAGTINKAGAMDVIPDLRALRVIMRLPNRGDDALLSALTAELETEGLAVMRAHELVPSLLTPPGMLTKGRLPGEMLEDIRFGWPVAKELGRLDIGQTIVVRKGVVAAVEALEGTDEAVRRGARLGGKGSVVVKVFKPGQEERVDMPSVGPGTIEAMREAGAACLAVEAGKSLFFERELAIALAEKSGIVVVGVTPELLEG